MITYTFENKPSSFKIILRVLSSISLFYLPLVFIILGLITSTNIKLWILYAGIMTFITMYRILTAKMIKTIKIDPIAQMINFEYSSLLHGQDSSHFSLKEIKALVDNDKNLLKHPSVTFFRRRFIFIKITEGVDVFSNSTYDQFRGEMESVFALAFQ